jgi:2-iminobutanoate/2-iminopropanoate deaminase
MTSDRRDVVKAAVTGAAGLMAAAILNSKATAATESGGGLIKLVPYDPPRNYARASVYGRLIFHCGEDSKDPKTQQVRGKTAGEQAGFTFENIQSTLLTLGSSLDHVIKITTLLRDPRDEASYQKAFAKYLPHQPPATTIMGVQLAYSDMIVEIEAIAVIPG